MDYRSRKTIITQAMNGGCVISETNADGSTSIIGAFSTRIEAIKALQITTVQDEVKEDHHDLRSRHKRLGS